VVGSASANAVGGQDIARWHRHGRAMERTSAGCTGPFQCQAMEASGWWPACSIASRASLAKWAEPNKSLPFSTVFFNEPSNASNFKLPNTMFLKFNIFQTWQTDG
jgi:hypothetical protein